MSRIDRSCNARPTRLTEADYARQERALAQLAKIQRQAACWRRLQRLAVAALAIALTAALFYKM